MEGHFMTAYRQMGSHRRKCAVCGRLIQDGERVIVRQNERRGYYPVKGSMRFVNWQMRHAACPCEGWPSP